MLWRWVNTGQQVFILDIDGTLIPSADIDNRCYWQAVFACYGMHGTYPDLHGFEHVSDSGILAEFCQDTLGRPASSTETAWIKRRFGELINEAANSQPAHFAPLPGVEEWLEAVREQPRVRAGIATGGWRHSARLKLRLARLDRFALPLASSDDAVSRTDIMRIAASRTVTQTEDDDIVYTYVGDGAWDLQASNRLGWKFIGIGEGENATRLEAAGATDVRADFVSNRSEDSV